MSSVPKRSRVRAKAYKSAADWPSTPEVDGVHYGLGPDPADAQWAAENLNSDGYDTDESTPDDVLERQADEAMELDRLERGIRFF